MERYKVTGMSCAACSAKVEKAALSVEGVTSCSVNLLTGDMITEGTASPNAVIKALENAGYGATRKDAPKGRHSSDETKSEALMQLRRLVYSAVLLIPLMYISMGHGMLGLPLPRFLTDSYVNFGLSQLLLSAAVMIINQKFFISGAKGIKNFSPNMDTLVSIGSGASFIYSTCLLFLTALAEKRGESAIAAHYVHGLYFESAAMILTLITVGKLLESRAKGKTTSALKALMSLAPETAFVIRDSAEVEVQITEVKVGDVFVVRPGGRFPVDGVIISGRCVVDESSLTGESIPVDKTEGDSVSTSSINMSGIVRCRATRVGEDTSLSQIIRMVSDASASKAPIARLADKVSAVFVPAVMGIALLTFGIWMALGENVATAFSRAISVLVISCPCALGLATPVAIMVGSGVGAKCGILFKTAASLETAGRLDTVVLDKTGTVTEGRPTVCGVIPWGSTTESELLSLAYSLEISSEHPLAKAIVSEGKRRDLTTQSVTDFKAFPGNGLEGVLGGEKCAGGKVDFLTSYAVVPKEMLKVAEKLADEGKTPLHFAKGGRYIGLVAVADTVKPDSTSAVGELKRMGLRVVMLTGDNERTASAIAKSAGIDEVIAGVLPDGKAMVICELKKSGRVAMVGDGINDAPALVSADIGIAIGAGVDIAVDSADSVLVKSRLCDLTAAIKLGRATLRNIKENLFWAFIYNVIGIPLAAGAFSSLLGVEMSPMLASAAMSLSSFCVVSNALRLNRVKLYPKTLSANNENSEKNNIIIKETKTMTKTVKIEGMMCPHCEAHMKKALEALDGVISAVTSHTDKCAVITSEVEIADEVIRAAVEGAGYTYVG
ncbi:MAG: heavy metal translocating P-type ATPase [Clostridia bacterium]|nr:heavy metal translocating P-type ATPase [Clostridia bacterium]